MENRKKSGWKIALLTGAAVAGAAFLLPHTVPAEAAPMPKMLSELKTPQGRPAGVYLKKDKPTLIKFWASWCPLCLSELGQTEKWAQDKRFSSANLITVASPGFLHEKKDGDFQKWLSVKQCSIVSIS